jgi:hypothetical protein
MEGPVALNSENYGWFEILSEGFPFVSLVFFVVTSYCLSPAKVLA